MTEDWASRLAMQIHGLTPDQESVVARFLRDERSRAVGLCKMAPIRCLSLGEPDSVNIADANVLLDDARRDIASAIEGE